MATYGPETDQSQQTKSVSHIINYVIHVCSIIYIIHVYTTVYTPNSKKVVFLNVALCIAHCCIPRPQSTMDVMNLYIVACQDCKALCSTLLNPCLIQECRCLI